MSERKVPEHAERIETADQVAERAERDCSLYGNPVTRAVAIRDDQIRRALNLALAGSHERPIAALNRVRDLLAKIGGPL